jgi:hypothetical protein
MEKRLADYISVAIQQTKITESVASYYMKIFIQLFVRKIFCSVDVGSLTDAVLAQKLGLRDT